MDRSKTNSSRAEQLSRLTALFNSTVETIQVEWTREDLAKSSSQAESSLSTVENDALLASPALYNAQRTLMGFTGSLTELVSEPQGRLLEVSSQFFESRALHIAAEHRIADFLDGKDEDGVHVEDLGEKIGIESLKLARILRCLCSHHLFKEVKPERFANNRITKSLVHNEPLRAYLMLFGLDIYSASDYLPATLTDLKWGPSYKVEETAFQKAVGTNVPRWSWLEQMIPKDHERPVREIYPRINGGSNTDWSHDKANNQVDGRAKGKEMVPRPELEIFGLAMVGGGRVFGTAHLHDYGWAELGKATVVDIGGGIGGFDLQLCRVFPELSFIVQDRAATIEQGKTMWAKENPAALQSGQVTFMEHDFFERQPFEGADVYWLRYILHDWSDAYCIRILSSIVPAMRRQRPCPAEQHPRSLRPGRQPSRILIADQIMNTTLGDPALTPAPAPLLANYSYHTRYSHQRDLCMMSIINGVERTPSQFRAIIEAAGLKMHRVWEVRSQVGIVECRLPDDDGDGDDGDDKGKE